MFFSLLIVTHNTLSHPNQLLNQIAAMILQLNQKEPARKETEASQANSFPEPIKNENKVGRNEPCPCGRGKKCCG
jgi:uncharacterized protein YecA (UPF0149 family)